MTSTSATLIIDARSIARSAERSTALNDDALRSSGTQQITTAGNRTTIALLRARSIIFATATLTALCLETMQVAITVALRSTSVRRNAATLDASQFANSMASCLTRLTSVTANNAMSIVS